MLNISDDSDIEPVPDRLLEADGIGDDWRKSVGSAGVVMPSVGSVAWFGGSSVFTFSAAKCLRNEKRFFLSGAPSADTEDRLNRLMKAG